LFYDEYGVNNMPKKTLALISGLVLVTVVLFVIALRQNQNADKSSTNPTPVAESVTPTPDVAHSVLSLSPNPVTVAPGAVGRVEVNIAPSDNAVTAVQLELSYDPKVIRNVRVVPGPLFQNSVELINKNDTTTGTYTYAFGKTPAQTPVTSPGVVATITFTATASDTPSQLLLLPSTLVTARGVASSVLKSATGTQIVVSSGAGVNLPQTQSSPSAGL
jgi:hypothetical protein